MEHEARATFAGGCFWCTQSEFDRVPGVVSTTVGYTGGSTSRPSYKEVCSGTTGHFEAIEVRFDPTKVSFEQLLEIYWHSIDPTNAKGQFCDIGSQYRPVIFYHDQEQRRLAEESKEKLVASGRFDEVGVLILPASAFYPAEEYHQRYYEKSPGHYERYKHGSGRENVLREVWGLA